MSTRSLSRSFPYDEIFKASSTACPAPRAPRSRLQCFGWIRTCFFRPWQPWNMHKTRTKCSIPLIYLQISASLADTCMRGFEWIAPPCNENPCPRSFKVLHLSSHFLSSTHNLFGLLPLHVIFILSLRKLLKQSER